jgi:hypothetical protein
VARGAKASPVRPNLSAPQPRSGSRNGPDPGPAGPPSAASTRAAPAGVSVPDEPAHPDASRMEARWRAQEALLRQQLEDALAYAGGLQRNYETLAAAFRRASRPRARCAVRTP